MKKLFIRFFHILFIIHLSGYVQQNAYAGNARPYTALMEQLKGSEHIFTTEPQDDTTPKIQSYPAHIRKIVEFVSGDVEEENESGSSKKYLESGNCLVSIFHTASTEYFPLRGKNSLTYFRQLVFLPVSDRHVLFQVFRI